MTTLNQASPDFIEFMYTGIDEAVSSIQDGDEFITFAIFQEGVERRMIRFVTENIEDGENVAIQQISAFEQKPEWALIVYDGFVTVNDQRTHAIIVNAYDRNLDDGFVFIQKYQPRDGHQSFELIENA